MPYDEVYIAVFVVCFESKGMPPCILPVFRQVVQRLGYGLSSPLAVPGVLVHPLGVVESCGA